MTWRSLERLAQDLRYGLRSMPREPSSPCSRSRRSRSASVPTRHLQFFDSVLLRPLPVADPNAVPACVVRVVEMPKSNLFSRLLAPVPVFLRDEEGLDDGGRRSWRSPPTRQIRH